MKENTHNIMEGELMDDFELSYRQKDALQEAGNIAAAHAASALSKLLGEKVMINVSECRITNIEKIPQMFGDVTNIVVATYVGLQNMERGSILLLYSKNSAMDLCDVFSKREKGTTKMIGDKELGVLVEIGNICICKYVNALSKLLDITLMPDPPAAAVDMIGAILEVVATDSMDEFAILIETDFIYKQGRSKGHILFLPDNESRHRILRIFKVDNAT